MDRYRCKDCGNEVEAPERPAHCPCGSENIVEVEETTFTQKLKGILGF